jgi:diaminohydroxyphosphoribosylaminopyrimidine deaminase / 5-amino-6-(5-phosphoribosylamino)uracil reductase
VSINALDEQFMRQALALAERGRGHTHPNPVVGTVIVRGGRVLATGYHRRAGQPHAEIEALSQKGLRPKGATLYVTLEPCCHQGRTGPCTDAILAAGIRRVVVGCCDENPLVSGRGVLRLRRAGIRVDVGCLKDECRAQNKAFFRWIRGKRPWVTLKVAATLDGFISAAPPPRDPRLRFVTGPKARAFSHNLRAKHNAILVGAGTILADNPRLTVRAAEGLASGHLRVVLDGNMRTPPTARIFRQFGGSPTLIIGAQSGQGRQAAARQKRERALRRAGAEVLLLPADRAGRIPIRLVLRALAERGIQSLLVEGGSKIHAAFISARMVDSVAFFFAPRLVGSGCRIVEGPGLDWRAPLRLGPLSASTIGKDVLLQADVVHPSGTL